MSKNYKNLNKPTRTKQNRDGIIDMLEKNFEIETLYYLDEKIIDHLLDSLALEKNGIPVRCAGHFNDYSFLTAPAYKALEGFLFQIAKDIDLPSSGRPNSAGSYYIDEKKVDKQIDNLIKELEKKTETTQKLSAYEKKDIKERIKEMDGFLRHYRHVPAHFYGERMDSIEKATRNIMTIFGCIDNSASILLKSKLIQIKAIDFQITEASYGTQNYKYDVADKLNSLIKDNKLIVRASNGLAGDPEKGVKKRLIIKYIFDGKQLEKGYDEDDQVALP